MSMENLPQPTDNYILHLDQIGVTLESGRRKVWQAANAGHLLTNWEIGKHIVEYEQQGNERAEYGANLLKRLSKDLTLRHGKGFSRSNVNYIRLFYKRFPIVQTLSVQLEWGHLLKSQ